MVLPWLQKVRALAANPKRLQAAVLSFSGTVVLTTVAVGGLMVTIRALGAFQGAELNAYDRLLRRRADEGMDQRLLVVGITEEDIQTRSEFPIHDGTLATALTKLDAMQPRAIGLDIARDIPQGDGREALLQILAKSDRIIAGCKLSSRNEFGVPAPAVVPPERIAFTDLPLDAKGIIRRSLLVSTPMPSRIPPLESSLCNDPAPNNLVMSLSLALARQYLAAEGIFLEPTESHELKFGEVVLRRLGDRSGGYANTGAIDYQVMLNYRTTLQPVRVVSLGDVLADKVDAAWVQDRIVLVGYTATMAKDVFFTPFSVGDQDELAMPGVVIHAQATSQILSAVLQNRPLIWYWPWLIEALWIVGWSLAGGLIAWMVRKPLVLLLAEGGAILLLYGISALVFVSGGWLPLVPAAYGLVISTFSVVILDRANRSGYTQAIYEQMKEKVQGAIKPQIQIDQEKRQREVAEITETGYFQDLVARAKEIREKRAKEVSDAS